MEDVLLFVKSVDNSHLRRGADPAERRAWTKMVLSGCIALLLTVVAFGPRAWLRHSGYRQAELIEQRQELLEIQRQLTVRVAQLSDLRRVGRLAAVKGLQSPPAYRYAWQDLTVSPMPTDVELAESFRAVRP